MCHHRVARKYRTERFSEFGVATMVVEILLEVGRFDMDGSMELTVINVHIDVQESDLGGGGVPCAVDMIVIVESFKDGGEGVRTMGPKKECVVDEAQPKAGFVKLGIKEILLKVACEQVRIGRGHTGAHGHAFDVVGP